LRRRFRIERDLNDSCAGRADRGRPDRRDCESDAPNRRVPPFGRHARFAARQRGAI
jgi:hypothetical protein